MSKICFLSLNVAAPWGGSEDLWYKTAKTLIGKGYSISVIFFDWEEQESPNLREIEKLGIYVIRIPFIGTTKVRIRRLLNPLLGDMNKRCVKKAILKIKPDLVVHTNMGPRGRDVLAYAISKNIPYILDIQLSDEFLWHVCNDDTVNCYVNAKAVYFLADRNRNATEKQLGTKLINARKHFNPIKTSRQLPDIKTNGVVNFACVGRMGVEHKRQDLVLEILASEKWRNRNWKLYFYGRGEHLQSLKNLVKMYQLEQKVYFEGHVSNINSVWEKCQVLLLPSTYEGMSLAVMECMQAGRVPVVTNTGGSCEFIINGEHGFIAEAATFNLFSDAMERALQQIDNWPEIGKQAQQRLKQIVPPDAAAYFAEEIISHL